MMKQTITTYHIFRLASAALMMIALLWLTVSLPVVYASQQEFAKLEKTSPAPASDCNDDENANPYGNNTEEKAPSTSVSEEYLHDHHKSDYFYSIISRTHKCEKADAYTAFHGEVQVPPPNRA